MRQSNHPVASRQRPVKKKKRPLDRRFAIIGGSLLGVLLTVVLGVVLYYFVMVSKLKPESAVFTGQADLALAEIASAYDEEIRTDVSDDVEAAEAHESQFEALLAEATEDAAATTAKTRVTKAAGSAATATLAPTPVPQVLPAIRRGGNVHNFLVIGVDSNANDFSGRSDAMMIISINYNTGTISMASLFRAAYVQIPGYGWSMLNHAYAWGGVSLLVQTVEQNFRVGIDDFIVFNFNAFTNAINAIGGIDVPLTAAEAGALGLAPGVNHLDSWQALSYARLRSIDWDFNRMGRQRQVIASVVGKLTGADIGTINAAVGSVLSSTATSLGQGQVASLTANLPSLLNYGRIETQIPLPYTRQMFYKGGMEMWSFDFLTNINALHQFIYGY